MSYLAMTAAPIEQLDGNINGTQQVINNLKKINKQNRTRRRLGTAKTHMETNERYPTKSAFTTHEDLETDMSSDNNLEDFSPLPTPESVGAERRKEKEALKDEDRQEIQNQQVASYSNISNQHAEQPSNINDAPMGSDINLEDYRRNIAAYYQQHPTQPNQPNQPNLPITQKTELTEKLNYLIHLLEEQQDEKTHNVTEEVILYSFLGIFIIFVVDSFARVGKYVR